MSPFWSGFLGAFVAIFSLFTLRRIIRFAVWGRHHRHGRRGFPRRGLNYLFRRLGTRPDQESLLRAEAETLFSELTGLGGEASSVRAELAALFTAQTLDEAAVSAVLEKPLARFNALRARVASSLARVYAILDAPQRGRLAELVRAGPGCRGHGAHSAPA